MWINDGSLHDAQKPSLCFNCAIRVISKSYWASLSGPRRCAWAGYRPEINKALTTVAVDAQIHWVDRLSTVESVSFLG
jgi:hypothetical protein